MADKFWQAKRDDALDRAAKHSEEATVLNRQSLHMMATLADSKAEKCMEIAAEYERRMLNPNWSKE